MNNNTTTTPFSSEKTKKKQELKTPELRFSHFDDDWQEVKLKDIANINPKSSEIPDSFYYIDLESVNSGKLINKNKIDRENAPSRAQRLLQINDILFSSVRPYQQNNLIFNFDNNGYVASTGFIQIRSDKSNINYLYYYLHTHTFLNKVLKLCTGSNYPTITSNDLKNIKIKIPLKEEQKKLGDFLSEIDKKLFLMEQKLSLYQNIKEYYLNKIYEQKFINQKSYIIEDIVDLISIRKYQIKKSEIKQDGVFPVVDQGKETIAGYFDDESKVFKDVPIIIYGDHTTNLKYMEKPFIVGGDGVKLLKLNNNMDLKYIYYAFISNNINSEGYKRHFSIFKNKEIGITEDIKKQNKIGNLFYSMDILLNIMKNKIKILKRYKQGLLQRMFV